MDAYLRGKAQLQRNHFVRGILVCGGACLQSSSSQPVHNSETDAEHKALKAHEEAKLEKHSKEHRGRRVPAEMICPVNVESRCSQQPPLLCEAGLQ